MIDAARTEDAEKIVQALVDNLNPNTWRKPSRETAAKPDDLKK